MAGNVVHRAAMAASFIPKLVDRLIRDGDLTLAPGIDKLVWRVGGATWAACPGPCSTCPPLVTTSLAPGPGSGRRSHPQVASSGTTPAWASAKAISPPTVAVARWAS